MIGWWIIVSTQTPEERDRADQDTHRHSRACRMTYAWPARAIGQIFADAKTPRHYVQRALCQANGTHS